MNIITEVSTKELDKWLRELRRIEAHRVAGTEKTVRKMYRELLDDLKMFIAQEYELLGDDDRLTWEVLQKKQEYASFISEVERRVYTISPDIAEEIRNTVESLYSFSYEGLVNSVEKSAGKVEKLGLILTGLKGLPVETVKQSVQNPIWGLTLNDALEKHRNEVVYNIKKELNIGLINGDRYSTMARRMSNSLDGDYKKAIRIVRTESHRNTVAGNLEAALAIDKELQASGSGYRMFKTWLTMQDERVRPTRKKDRYNHRILNKQCIPVDEYFNSNGVKTMAPLKSGIAGFDVNCRCELMFEIKKVK